MQQSALEMRNQTLIDRGNVSYRHHLWAHAYRSGAWRGHASLGCRWQDVL